MPLSGPPLAELIAFATLILLASEHWNRLFVLKGGQPIVGTPTSTVTSTLRVRWARRLALVAALVVLPVATGCSANFGAETNQPYHPAAGRSDRSGQVYVINALVVGDGEGNGTVVAALINQASEDDELVGFEAEHLDGGGLDTTPLTSDGIELPSQKAANLPEDDVLQISGDAVQPGTVLNLTFTFQNAAPVTIGVPVLRQTEIYSGVTVGPIEKTTGPTETTPSGD